MPQNLPSEPLWNQMRAQMPVAREYAYMDHAAVAPLPEPTREVVLKWCQQAVNDGDLVWREWAEQMEAARKTAAQLLGADTTEIAFVPNTTAGISLVAEGYPWSEGDNMVTLANEFPSNLYPWMNLESRGVEARQVPITDSRVDLEQVLARCDKRTRLISISWVGYSSGWRVDLAPLVEQAHERGILVFLDAIQGLGVFPLDVRATPVDFVAADGHKWMLGPEGAGVFYLKREHLDLLRPFGVGWNSVRHSHDFQHIELDLHDTARRYEGGSQNMVGVLALGASLKFLADMGLASTQSAVAERVLAVSDYAVAELQEAGAQVLSDRTGSQRSGIVAFRLPGVEPETVRDASVAAGIALSCRGGNLRISPHAYNNTDDIARLIDVVKSMPGR